jgi:hypothetical protein
MNLFLYKAYLKQLFSHVISGQSIKVNVLSSKGKALNSEVEQQVFRLFS